MAKDISANAELSGGKIEAVLSLSNNKLTTDAGIHGLIPVKGKSTQADWNEDDPSSDAYIKNKPVIPSKTSELTNDSNFATKSYVDGLVGNISSLLEVI